MTEFVLGVVIGGSGGGVLGYFLRAKMDEHFATRREGRAVRIDDARQQRELLVECLGEIRQQFEWIQAVADDPGFQFFEVRVKADKVREWAYRHAPRFPEPYRRNIYVIGSIATILAGGGGQEFLDAYPRGYEMIVGAWGNLERYLEELTQQLHAGGVAPPR